MTNYAYDRTTVNGTTYYTTSITTAPITSGVEINSYYEGSVPIGGSPIIPTGVKVVYGSRGVIGARVIL